MREKERAQRMIKIMIDRIKETRTDEELLMRRYRACGAVFILYFLDILTYEEQSQYEDEIFK